jgi:hypothetical protein
VTLIGRRLPYRCLRCAHPEGVITAGKGPHLAALVCSACSRWLKWIGRVELLAVLGAALKEEADA